MLSSTEIHVIYLVIHLTCSICHIRSRPRYSKYIYDLILRSSSAPRCCVVTPSHMCCTCFPPPHRVPCSRGRYACERTCSREHCRRVFYTSSRTVFGTLYFVLPTTFILCHRAIRSLCGGLREGNTLIALAWGNSPSYGLYNDCSSVDERWKITNG